MYQKLEQSFWRETPQTHQISFRLIVNFENMVVGLNVLIMCLMLEILKF